VIKTFKQERDEYKAKIPDLHTLVTRIEELQQKSGELSKQLSLCKMSKKDLEKINEEQREEI